MIAWITARGGSQRLPGKNIKLLAGRPLIAYTVDAATQSAMIDRVLLSTDDPAIAAVVCDFGAEVPFLRPTELSTSAATSRDVLLHALKYLEDNGTSPSSFCLLQPTSPLRLAADVDSAAKLFDEQPPFSPPQADPMALSGASRRNKFLAAPISYQKSVFNNRNRPPPPLRFLGALAPAQPGRHDLPLPGHGRRLARRFAPYLQRCHFKKPPTIRQVITKEIN